jgi:transposase
MCMSHPDRENIRSTALKHLHHRVERQEKQSNDEHLYEELKRLRKDNARLKEERDILKKAAAYFAQQLP